MGALCVELSYPHMTADSEQRRRRTFAEDIEGPGCSNLDLPSWILYSGAKKVLGVTTGKGVLAVCAHNNGGRNQWH